MTAKNYLRQIRLLDQRITQRMEEAAELRQLALGFHAVEIKQDAVQTSPDGDKMAEAVGRYVDLEEEINRMIDDFVDLKHKIIGEIQKLDDDRLMTLLHLRYVRYMTFEKIAVEMGYTYQWVCELHGQALQAFEKIRSEKTTNGT